MSNINNVSGTSGGLSVNAKRWIYICISLIVLVFIKNVSFPASIATIKDATLTECTGCFDFCPSALDNRSDSVPLYRSAGNGAVGPVRCRFLWRHC